MFEVSFRSLAAALVVAAAVAMAAASTASAQNNSAAKSQATPIPTSGPPVESEHVRGPDGLEGWTLKYPIPDRPDERLPLTLVLARNGAVVRRISGDLFVWDWEFCPDGKQIAYETGPLHFALECNLEDISSGRILWSEDCWRGLPKTAPECVKDLEKSN